MRERKESDRVISHLVVHCYIYNSCSLQLGQAKARSQELNSVSNMGDKKPTI